MQKRNRSLIEGLYAITPDELDTAELLRKVRLVLRGGAEVLQYRNKSANAELRREQALALRALTREFAVTFIVNDDAALALAVDADGVHLGGDDGSVAEARRLMGESRLIGVSCYNRQDRAMQAELDGADYIAFGAFFTSSVKPNAPVASLAVLEEASSKIALPIVAIGGVTHENGEQLLEAGAHALAVISAIFSAPDIEQAARKFAVMADS